MNGDISALLGVCVYVRTGAISSDAEYDAKQSAVRGDSYPQSTHGRVSSQQRPDQSY